MYKLVNWIIKTFYNVLYRIKPPPAVSYWKKGDTARARVVKDKDGSYKMQIEGEKELFPSFPKGYLLTGTVASMKNYIKNQVFNAVFAELEKRMAEQKFDVTPVEHLPIAVRHIWETFEKLEEAEIVPDMRARITLIKKVLCHILETDDAYRLRAQLFLDLIDQKKIRMTKADRYYCRGKYYRPDRYLKIGKTVFDKFEY